MLWYCTSSISPLSSALWPSVLSHLYPPAFSTWTPLLFSSPSHGLGHHWVLVLTFHLTWPLPSTVFSGMPFRVPHTWPIGAESILCWPGPVVLVLSFCFCRYQYHHYHHHPPPYSLLLRIMHSAKHLVYNNLINSNYTPTLGRVFGVLTLTLDFSSEISVWNELSGCKCYLWAFFKEAH